MSARMIEVKTAELEGVALDWAVGLALGGEVCVVDELDGRVGMIITDAPTSRLYRHGDSGGHVMFISGPGGEWAPSTEWSQGGPFVESNPWALPYRATHRYHIGAFEACTPGGFPHNGSTPLIAACRAIVAAKLGESVMVPEELVKP